DGQLWQPRRRTRVLVLTLATRSSQDSGDAGLSTALASPGACQITPVTTGSLCQPDARDGVQPPAHMITDPHQDPELQAIYSWLLAQPVEDLLRIEPMTLCSTCSNGARTWRF